MVSQGAGIIERVEKGRLEKIMTNHVIDVANGLFVRKGREGLLGGEMKWGVSIARFYDMYFAPITCQCHNKYVGGAKRKKEKKKNEGHRSVTLLDG